MDSSRPRGLERRRNAFSRRLKMRHVIVQSLADYSLQNIALNYKLVGGRTGRQYLECCATGK